MYENVRKIAVCALILQKWHPKSKCRPFLRSSLHLVFFGQVRGNLRKFGGTLSKNGAWSVLLSQKMRPTWKEMQSCFRRSLSLEFFGNVWGNLGKNPSHPKILPAPTPMTCISTNCTTAKWQRTTKDFSGDDGFDEVVQKRQRILVASV